MSRTLPLGLLVSAVALTGMAGCGKDEEAKPSPSESSASKATVPNVVLPKQADFKVEKAKPSKGKSAGAEETISPVGALIDVKVVSCPTDNGEQTAKLELTNSSKKARDYSIMVIWLKNGDGQPRGAAVVNEKGAAPGKKITLTAKAKVVEKADKCVLNVMAGTIK